MNRSLALGLLSGLCLTMVSYTDTNAADLYRPSIGGMKEAYAAPFTWSGFYIGLQAGWAWPDVDTSFDNGAPSVSLDTDGFIGGGHVGYNFQRGNWVFGIEGDFEGADLHDSSVSGPIVGVDSFASFDANWLASIRGRLGYAFDRSLLYVTGGAAFTDVEFRGGPVGGPANSNSDTLTGWTVGGGWEYAFGRNLTGRIEYRFISFEDAKGDLAPDFPTVDQKFDLDVHTVRVGISYKFGPRYEEPLK